MQKSISLLPNKLTLYRRSHSGRWQCRYKLKGRGWHRESTGEHELDDAREAAFKLYYSAEERARNNLPVNTRRFKHVAEHAKQRMQQELAYGTGKGVYKQYVRVIDQHLIPYFGNRQIDSITVADLHDYAAWRDEAIAYRLYEQKREALKKRIKRVERLREALQQLDASPPPYQPSQTVVNTHNAALNRVFDEALLHGWITESIRPSMLNKAAKTDTRGSFEFDEYRRITDTLRSNWLTQTPSEQGKRIRRVLREYVLILANTGMRHGTEATNMRWSDVNYYTDARTGERYFEFYVRGKTGQRSLIARDGVYRFLERLKDMDTALADKTLDEVIALRSDKYLFRDDTGERVSADQLRQAFRRLLDERGLRRDRDGKNRSLYSLRHMYATRALAKGQNIYVLSVQMGTSVKMLEQHYSKLTARMRAEELSGRVRTIERSEES
ncbi:tyrosine-type recombinase/integrase [Spiribacter aquaticus]|uniref:Tyrosine-type recombinase/integrase n=1 Tax=Spiribacter aquaticus TaxID=1935996 RepID=A0A557RMS5_9GAMM|nr:MULTISPECIES: tyrosine-type recombinase/integrase [Spiribacter]TVO66467.1 tyrosine-type recombinase/integrase [Spiribacter aquaticus]